MKPWWRRVLLGGLLVALQLPPPLWSADPPGAPPPSIARLAWLAGSWRLERNGRITDEQWMAPAGGVMLGMARTVAKGRLIEHEFVQIRTGPDGILFYIALPSGQKEATFQVTSQTENSVVFENPQHDFPQKISYTLQTDGTLLAVIEGSRAGGESKRIEYPYRRVQPPPQP